MMDGYKLELMKRYLSVAGWFILSFATFGVAGV